jgi:uncharacterized membrane protein
VNKARVESFSDGVFAFAITVLVLAVQIPNLGSSSDRELRDALLRTAPQLLPYVTSFATIGIIWMNHHAMFHFVERVEHTTLALNLLRLLVVAFIPYPTAILCRYGALPSSAVLYGAVLSLLGLTYSLLWFHIVRKRLSSSSRDEKDVRRKIKRTFTGPLVYPTATLLAFRFPKVSVVLYFLLAVFYFIPAGSRSWLAESHLRDLS